MRSRQLLSSGFFVASIALAGVAHAQQTEVAPLTPASSLKGANLKNAVILSIPTRAASYGEE